MKIPFQEDGSVIGPIIRVDGEYGRLEGIYNIGLGFENLHLFFYLYTRDHDVADNYVECAAKLLRDQIKHKLNEAFTELAYEVEEQTLREIDGLSHQKAKKVCKELRKFRRSSEPNLEREKNKRMSLPYKGRPETWAKEELGRSVRTVVSDIPYRLSPTLPLVAKKLAMPSGEALGKLLKRKGLVWKELKKRT